MGYQHGIYIKEESTNLTALSVVTRPNVVVGTAPIHLANKRAAANEPILCNSIAEFSEQFGYSEEFEKYTLCEAAQAHYQLFNVAPVIFINVLDPEVHSKTSTQTVTGNATLSGEILLDTLEVVSGSGSSAVTLTADVDYTAEYNNAGAVNFSVLTEQISPLNLTYKETNASAVSVSDVIGGYDTATGKNSGLECVEEIYPRFRMIPNSIIAPGWSTEPTVAAVLAAKAKAVNGCFRALAVVDLDTARVKKYTDCGAAKTLSDNFAIACWPKVKLGNKQYHLSSQVAALMCRVDADNGDIPYRSPSNQSLQMESGCLRDGTEIYLTKEQANTLNGLGIVTCLNWSDGWKAWGNSVSCHPANSDPIGFISCRRMMSYLCNTLITSYWSKVDEPITRRLVLGIVDSIQQWLNSLTAAGMLLGGNVSFLDSDNTAADLASGKLTFHLSVMPPVPAQTIEFDVAFDTQFLSSLFS